jgi:MoxR-like ATPase
MTQNLTPAQDSAFTSLQRALSAGNLVLLFGAPGFGRTTILHHLHRETGGGFLGAKEFLASSGARHPLALEEALHASVSAAMLEHDVV